MLILFVPSFAKSDVPLNRKLNKDQTKEFETLNYEAESVYNPSRNLSFDPSIAILRRKPLCAGHLHERCMSWLHAVAKTTRQDQVRIRFI